QIPCFKLCEDEATLAFMDINPAHDGHCLVISKDHAPTIFDIGEETLTAVARAVRRVSRAVNAALAPQGLSLVQANGEGAKQSVPHFHIHVLPRLRRRAPARLAPAPRQPRRDRRGGGADTEAS